MRGWFESTFGAGALAVQFVIALIVVIVLFAIIAAFARRRNKHAGPAQKRGRQPRLAVMDMAVVDDRRKLLLIRRDNVEHLMMIGGSSDLVIESAIVRNRPAPHAVERAPDYATAGLAAQARSSAQTRAQIGTQLASASGSEATSGEVPQPGSGSESRQARTAPPVLGPQFVNPYKPPEVVRQKKPPGQAASADRASPAAVSAQPVQTPSPASSTAAVAGLAAGAAALTAAAAKAKRRELSSEPEPETPPEKPANAPPVLPVGLNGGDDLAIPTANAAPDAAAEPVTPKPVAPEPAASDGAVKGAKEPDAKTADETATEPAAAADVTSEATPSDDAQSGTDSGAAAKSEQKPTDKAPVDKPATAAKPAPAESVELTAKTTPEEDPPEDEPVADTADVADTAVETGAGDDLEAALAEALSPPQDQSSDAAGTSAEAVEPTPTEPVDAAPDSTEASPAATAGLAAARAFDENIAKSAGGDDPDIVTLPQADVPASPEPETTVAAADNTEADTADKMAEPAAQRFAAINPFPSIPEDVRRSVLEAARRAERSMGSGSADMADGGEKTTLGDLAERLEQALAEQASSLSDQFKSAASTKPAPGPAQNPATSIEAWERGELTPAGAQTADGAPEAAPSPAAEPEAAPRQSQALLEDETDPGVIDFSDRKKASSESKPSDSLEDEMARLLGELTGRTSGR